MAVTQSRDPEKFEKMKKVGASGGNAVEGYGRTTIDGFTASIGVKGVASRSKEDEDKRFAEAKKFMDSQRKADDVDVEKVEKAREKEADKKPTAPNAQVETLEMGKGQSPQATEKEELSDIKAEAGDTEGAEKAKAEAQAVKKETPKK